MTDQQITIAENQRFSDCIFWDMQREYYDKQGINAWNKQVPFHATCNPYVANCYANIAVSFVRDWLRLHPASITQPFYIMELGTGSGLFSFYMLKAVRQLCQQLQLDHVRIIYVMTDFTESNLNYWQQHPALQYYLDQGLLDFAFFNLETEEEIHLLRSKVTLSKKALVNPLMVCANYIFDSISTDAFTAKDGDIFESLVTLKTDDENIENGKPISWDKIDLSYQSASDDLQDYYDDELFNQVLYSYSGRLKNTNFLLPIATLRTIRKLANDSNGNVLLISSDIALTHIDQLEGQKSSKPSFSGSHWVSVNYDAIAQYFKYRGGDVALQPYGKSLSTNVFVLGEQFSQLSETNRAIEQYTMGFAPSDILVLLKSTKKQLNDLKLDDLVSLLKLSLWDPWVFHLLSVRINALIGEAGLSAKRFLRDGMQKIEANYYYMPSTINTLLEIGRFFQTLKEYSIALEYYAKSEALFGKQFDLISSKAFCAYHLGEKVQARELFEQAAALNPQLSCVTV
ncbi:MAG: SAM-dependent methyltransferase [Coxiellaceae bacterium]|nr:SAM-dependent methyltransferase [Coxiellaceae bacterium]